MKQLKKKRCKATGCYVCFDPSQPWVIWCSPECGAVIGLTKLNKLKAAKIKAEKKKDKERKEKQEKVSAVAARVQKYVNKYVNLRDKHLPCICCGKSPYSGVRHAGHFKSRGSNSFLRFNLWNIHSCCYSCNTMKGGNINEYRPALVDKIGAEKVEYLDNAPRSREYTKEYLARLQKIMIKKIKRLEKRMENENY
tara:strand:- start:413 stop:997 length:585 start_codon:yes stop_codon:yes gene_type:complete